MRRSDAGARLDPPRLSPAGHRDDAPRRNEAAQLQLAATRSTERPRVLGTGGPGTNRGAQALARTLGYEPVRRFEAYESAALQPTERFVAWRKPMEPDR